MEGFKLIIILMAIASGALSKSQSKTYELTVQSLEDVHCQPCSELEGQNWRHHLDHHQKNGTDMCCASTPKDILQLVDWKLKQMQNFHIPIHHTTTHKVAVHAVLSTDRTSNRADMQDILRTEWTIDKNYTYCDAEDSHRKFCEEFEEPMASEEAWKRGIRLPFDGYYTINCRVAWQPPKPSQPKNFNLEFSRKPAHATNRDELAQDRVLSDCDPLNKCMAAIQRTLRLAKGDELYFSVSNKKDVLQGAWTYLEILGRPA